MKTRLDFREISNLDEGRIAAAVNKELARVTTDCVGRPDNKSARTVTLVISVTPDGSDGVCDRTLIDFQTSSKLPPRKSRQYHTACDAKGNLIVNNESPDNVDQMSLDEANAPAPQNPKA